MTEFPAQAAMGSRVRAQALVAKDGFSARYDLDRIKGVFSRPEHKLAGQSYVGRVLVLDAAKGGVATAWMLHEMQARGVMPAALVLNSVNPIMVQGVALAGFTLMSGFATDITQAVPDGAWVEVDTEATPPCLRIVTLSLDDMAQDDMAQDETAQDETAQDNRGQDSGAQDNRPQSSRFEDNGQGGNGQGDNGQRDNAPRRSAPGQSSARDHA